MSFLNIFLTQQRKVTDCFLVFYPEVTYLEAGPLRLFSHYAFLLTREGGVLKRTYSFLLAALLLGMLLPSIASAGQHGLVWGVQVGDRFEFTLTNSIYEITETDDFYVEVDSLPSLDEVTQIPVAGASYYWMDGSSMGLEGYASEFMIVPVGNWTFLTTKLEPQILNDYLEGQMIDTFLAWGFNVALYLDVYLCEIRLEVSKADGVPNILRVDYYEGAAKAGFVEMIRKGGVAPIVFGIVAVSAILIVLVLLRRRQ